MISYIPKSHALSQLMDAYEKYQSSIVGDRELIKKGKPVWYY
jgi:hypothetical protein